MKQTLVLLLLCIVFIMPSQAQSERLQVVASTTIIADIAQNVGGNLVDVVPLVPYETDIHAFEPLPSDIVLVTQADVLLINGAGLEGFLEDLLTNASDADPIVVGVGVPLLPQLDGESPLLGIDTDCTDDDSNDHDHEHDHAGCDPHYWLNPDNMRIVADNIAAAFAAADPTNAETYTANAAAYQAEIVALDAEINDLFAEIAPEQRILVTNHDFLAYFADHYAFEIIGTVIPGSSTLAEPSPRELADLVHLIEDTGVQAIIAEVSDANRLAEVVAAEVGAEIRVITLYSGSLSAPDGEAATYLDYLRYNAQAIATAFSE